MCGPNARVMLGRTRSQLKVQQPAIFRSMFSNKKRFFCQIKLMLAKEAEISQELSIFDLKIDVEIV